MSLAQNNNHAPPEWVFHTDGPAHAPRFTATVHLAGHTATADATTKTHVIVPMETEPLSFDPTARTIRKILEPRGIPYTVVINNWDPRDGKSDLEETKD